MYAVSLNAYGVTVSNYPLNMHTALLLTGKVTERLFATIGNEETHSWWKH